MNIFDNLLEGYDDDLMESLKERMSRKQSGGMKLGENGGMIYFYTYIKDAREPSIDNLKSINPRDLHLSGSRIEEIRKLIKKEDWVLYGKRDDVGMLLLETLNPKNFKYPILLSSEKLLGKKAVDTPSISVFEIDKNGKIGRNIATKIIFDKKNVSFENILPQLTKLINTKFRSVRYVIQERSLIYDRYGKYRKMTADDYYPAKAAGNNFFTLLLINKTLTNDMRKALSILARDNGITVDFSNEFFVKFNK